MKLAINLQTHSCCSTLHKEDSQNQLFLSLKRTTAQPHTHRLITHSLLCQRSKPMGADPRAPEQEVLSCHPRYTSFPHSLHLPNSTDLLLLSDKMTQGTCSCSETASLCTEALSWIMNMNIVMNNEWRIMFLSWSCAKRDETQRLACRTRDWFWLHCV